MEKKPLILLVEDDVRLANLVKDFFEAHEFDVLLEQYGNKVVKQIQNRNPDLIILDINLPGKDGLSVCRDVRPLYAGPLLMLTARNTDIDQLLGFEYGADDYVIKPADPKLLLARVKALLRRFTDPKNSQFSQLIFGQLNILMIDRRVQLGGLDLDLSSHEFDLLKALAENAGKIMTREYLFSHVYQREYDGLDRSVDVRISQLRKKVNDDIENPKRIKTIWGKGYLFAPDAWAEL